MTIKTKAKNIRTRLIAATTAAAIGSAILAGPALASSSTGAPVDPVATGNGAGFVAVTQNIGSVSSLPARAQDPIAVDRGNSVFGAFLDRLTGQANASPLPQKTVDPVATAGG